MSTNYKQIDPINATLPGFHFWGFRGGDFRGFSFQRMLESISSSLAGCRFQDSIRSRFDKIIGLLSIREKQNNSGGAEKYIRDGSAEERRKRPVVSENLPDTDRSEIYERNS